MKKIILLLLMTMGLLLAACSSSGDSETGSTDPENNKAKASDQTEQTEETTEKEEDGTVGVDKGLFNVEVTLPASYFEGEDLDQAIADAKEQGVGEVVRNDDGSVTYKMSKAAHKEMMAEMEKSVQESMEELKTSEDFVSIKDVTGNNDYTTFTVVVDQEAFENSFDGFAIFGIGIAGMYYQIFDGVDADKAKVEVNMEDEATGEVFSTSVFPDDLPE